MSSSSSSGSRKRGLDEGEEANGLQLQRPSPYAPTELDAPRSPAVARLYRHALESIFAFCGLENLSSLMAVSHDWQVAVLSMSPIGALLELWDSRHCERLVPSSRSRLWKHVTRAAIVDSDCVGVALPFLSQHLSQHLRTLELTVSAHIDPALILCFQRLQVLRLELKPSWRLPMDGTVSWTSAANVSWVGYNAMLKAIALLACLEDLSLTFSDPAPEVDFAFLSAGAGVAPLKLHSFALAWGLEASHKGLNLTEAQVAALRNMAPSIRSFSFDGLACSSEATAKLLRTPHNLQWQTLRSQLLLSAALCAVISRIHIDDKAAEALESLPTLTGLHVSLDGCSHVRFLVELTQLRTLDLAVKTASKATLTAEALLAGLQSCTGLTSLTLGNVPLTSAHMCTLLPQLPQLTQLHVARLHQLDSLVCFNSPALVASLTDLSIRDCTEAEAVAELAHLHGLKALQKLALKRQCALPAELNLLFTPPSSLLPRLTVLTSECHSSWGGRSHCKRTFEPEILRMR